MRAALLFVCLISTPALATVEPAADDNGGASATAPKAKEKQICKLEEQTSTSRMRKRVCRTAEQWEDSKQNKTTAADLQRMGSN